MESIADNIYYHYNSAIQQADPRTSNWFLVWKDPTAVLVLFFSYLLFVNFGKKYMQNRKEIYVPACIIFTYNMVLVILSIYMFYEFVVGIYNAKYDLLCARLNVSKSEAEMRVAKVIWLYFVSKAIELLDTVFMIIRKRFTQVTFLHCFHHSTMLLIWWIVVMWIPGGQSYFGATFNCFIHVFMYLYYALSVIPSLKNKLWWKKYITNLQLLQFVCTFTHVTYGLVRGCDFPKWGQYLLTIYMIIMIILFTNFYVHEYINKSNLKKRSKKLQNSDSTNGSNSQEYKSVANGSDRNKFKKN